MNLPSRKERKALAKKLGLVKKKESFKEMMSRIGRAQEFGKMLHMQHLENIQNQLNPKAEVDSEAAEELIETQQELKKLISDKNTEE